jgi:mannose-6-phosphate isomerase-like protein (cupin superfamily)
MSETENARRGVTIYRAADAQDINSTDFMLPPEMSDGTRVSLGDAVTEGAGAGAKGMVLMRQTDEEGGFSLLHMWFKADYPLPRHSHDSDCMYYVVSGEAIMGNQTLRAGDCFFVPANAPYVYNAGPDGVEVLEIRHGVRQFDMKIPDAAAGRWQDMVDTTVSNRERWQAETVSPTWSANQG